MSGEKHCYEYPRPSITTDVAVFTTEGGRLQILLIQRGEAPEGWALPGGFLQVGDAQTERAVAGGARPPANHFDFTLEDCARRELREEAGIEAGALQQIGAFGDADRDPRGRYVTVAYWGFVHPSQHQPRAGSDARAVSWQDIENLPDLAFDHNDLIAAALHAITSRRLETALFLELMPARFTYPEFHVAYEIASRRVIDRSSLHRRVLPFLREAIAPPPGTIGPAPRRGAHRPAIHYDKKRAIAAANAAIGSPP
ncbi:NUDIX domain-containing protein [Brevundimonas naejangsanensis]|nr:NUDIX hydrolase [Brevundimonas naejangsanensis]